MSLADMRHQLRQVDKMSDTQIRRDMLAARKLIENATGRVFTTTTYRWELDAFPGREIILPKTPYVSAGFQIEYYSPTGGAPASGRFTVTSTDYEVHDRGELPAIVELDSDKTWPATTDRLDAVQIVFTAGYGSIGLVPANMQRALVALTRFWFENPDTAGRMTKELEFSLTALIDSLKTGQHVAI